MQIKNITYGMTYKGYKRYRECINMAERLRQVDKSEIAKERIKIIEVYKEYGEKVTKAAFGIGRKTIYRWNKSLRESGGDIRSLIPISTRPNSVRKSAIDERIIKKIREIRQEHPRTGKEKIKVFLDKYCEEEGIKKISESSIGRIIAKNKMYYQPAYNMPIHREVKIRKKRERVKRSPKGKETGYIMADTVVVKEKGITRYFYNAIDITTKFAYSMSFKSLTSKNTVEFFETFQRVYPLKIRIWQNDNGHENLGEFEKKLKEEKIKHLFSYPRCPKINGQVERFNRTFREEFIDVDGAFLGDDDIFNNLLSDWLFYYNSIRPHLSLNLKSPLQFISQNSKMSHMY